MGNSHKMRESAFSMTRMAVSATSYFHNRNNYLISGSSIGTYVDAMFPDIMEALYDEFKDRSD